jgi:tetratricopeptide (TPR) repeat protein
MAVTPESAGFAALLAQGSEARRGHHFTQAKAFYLEAVEQARAANDSLLLATALTRLGAIERDLHNTETALELYQQSVELLRNQPASLADPQTLAHTVRHVADIALELRQPDLAGHSYEEALSIYRRDPQSGTLDLANALRGYALFKTAIGDTDAAISLWREAGTLYNEVWQEPGSPFSQADLAPGIQESAKQIALLSSR